MMLSSVLLISMVERYIEESIGYEMECCVLVCVGWLDALCMKGTMAAGFLYTLNVLCVAYFYDGDVKKVYTIVIYIYIFLVRNIILFFARYVTNLTYPIQTYAIYSSSNLIYILTCILCDAFYIGEIRSSLSTRTSGHQSSTNNPNNLSLLVAIYTKSHQLQHFRTISL